jgi:hypothetical protein
LRSAELTGTSRTKVEKIRAIVDCPEKTGDSEDDDDSVVKPAADRQVYSDRMIAPASQRLDAERYFVGLGKHAVLVGQRDVESRTARDHLVIVSTQMSLLVRSSKIRFHA